MLWNYKKTSLYDHLTDSSNVTFNLNKVLIHLYGIRFQEKRDRSNETENITF